MFSTAVSLCSLAVAAFARLTNCAVCSICHSFLRRYSSLCSTTRRVAIVARPLLPLPPLRALIFGCRKKEKSFLK
jgi:hypothetical protein